MQIIHEHLVPIDYFRDLGLLCKKEFLIVGVYVHLSVIIVILLAFRALSAYKRIEFAVQINADLDDLSS